MAIVFSPLSEDTHDNNEQAKSHESRLIKSIILLCLSMRKNGARKQVSNEFDSN